MSEVAEGQEEPDDWAGGGIRSAEEEADDPALSALLTQVAGHIGLDGSVTDHMEAWANVFMLMGAHAHSAGLSSMTALWISDHLDENCGRFMSVRNGSPYAAVGVLRRTIRNLEDDDG